MKDAIFNLYTFTFHHPGLWLRSLDRIEEIVIGFYVIPQVYHFTGGQLLDGIQYYLGAVVVWCLQNGRSPRDC